MRKGHTIMSRIENLGDYNTVRIMIQKKNGNLPALIKEYKDIGAHEALPKQLGIGALIGASILLGGQYAAKKAAKYVKKHKQEKIEREKVLKEDLETVLMVEGEISEAGELPC